MLTQSGVTRQEIIQLHLKSKYIYPHPNSAWKIVTWKCHVDDSIEGQYHMIIGRNLIMYLVIKVDDQKL